MTVKVERIVGTILSRHWEDRGIHGAIDGSTYGSTYGNATGASSPSSAPHKTSKQLTLSYWLKTDRGPVNVIISHQQAVFFVTQNSLDSALEQLALARELKGYRWTFKLLSLKNFRHEKVAALYFDQQRGLYLARQILRNPQGSNSADKKVPKLTQEKNEAQSENTEQIGSVGPIETFEADIQAPERFMMERFITSVMSVEGILTDRGGYFECLDPHVLRGSEALGRYLPRLNVLSLDIETSMDGKRLYSIACYAKQYCPSNRAAEHSASTDEATESIRRKIFMVGDPSCDSAEHTDFYREEKTLMREFLKWFADYDADIIIGWSVINFDLRFLQRKADLLHIPLTMGRDRQSLDWRQGRDDKEYFTLSMPGRAVLDGIETLKSASYNFESFSLEYVSRALLKRGKLIHKVDNRGYEITRLFEQDKAALARYNLEDCALVWEIFEHAQLIDFALARAKLTGLALDRFGGSVAAFDNRYLPLLHRQGYVAPLLQEDPPGVGSPGGYVMDSWPGLYHHVLVLDFKSLYPSIIRSFNIDPLALIKGTNHRRLEKTPSALETVVDDCDKVVPGFNGAVFDRSTRILPNLIEELWASRDLAKSENNAAMSQAIKILMNSFYGVMGTPGSRFFDARLPSSVTLRGHQILNRTRQRIEDQGYHVIYGDTDSLFVWLEKFPSTKSKSDVFSLGRSLVADLNAWWLQELKSKYHIESALEIEFETYFSRFFMPTIRGSEAGSKKRYAGRKVFEDEHKEDEIIFKGLEAVRTDWTALARDVQRELYRRIFYQLPFKEYVREIVAGIYSGSFDKRLIYRKRLRRDLEDYQNKVPPHVQAARISEAQRRKRGLPRYYRRGTWIEYVYTLEGPRSVETSEEASLALDYERYVARQIAPIVDSITQFLDSSFDDIAGQQLGLF